LVVTPNNPGNWESIRSVPIVPNPREFTRDEADILKQIAKGKTAAVKQTQKAYESLAQIEEADSKVHKAHRKYQGKVADSELTKIRSNARLAKHLHAIRPQYAQLDNAIDRAEQLAQQRIEQLQAKINKVYG
jgi:DNA repair exonuclease SbcCD ATPase subunit